MNTQNKQIIVYFANWYVGRKPAAKGGEVASIPWDRVTYVNHAFWAVAPADGSTETSFERRDKSAAPRSEFTILSMYPDNDYGNQAPSEMEPSLPKNHFAQYEAFSKRYPDVNIMISIGGWARCGYFSEMAYTAAGRSSFIQSCVDLIRKYPWIGGIDIDWEYPGCSTAGERQPDPNAGDGDEGCPIWGTAAEDSANFVSLLSELRTALDEHFGNGVKKLTACAGGSTTAILPRQNWAAAAPYLDMINLMTYDLAGTWDGVTGHASSFQGAKKAADYLTALGIPENKICIGSPLYAISFLMNEMNPDQIIGAPAASHRATDKEVAETECRAFEDQAVSGYTLKKEGVKWIKDTDFTKNGCGWHFAHDDKEGAAYLYNDDAASPYYKWFLTYENALSLQTKLDYINETDLAGIIIWECSQDTADYCLITQMAENLLVQP